MKKLQFLGAFFIILSLLILALTHQGFKIQEFKKNGVIKEARIHKKYKSEKSEPWGIRSVKQSPRYSHITKSDYYFDISFFKDKEGEKSIFKFTKTSFKVSDKTISEIKKGSSIEIIYIPENPEGSIIAFKDFENNFYQLPEEKITQYNQKGKKASAIIQEIDKKDKIVKVSFMLSSVSGLGELISSTIPVSKSIYDSFNTGDKIEIVYLAEDPQIAVSKKMLDSLIYLNPYMGILTIIVLILIGIYLISNKKLNKREVEGIVKTLDEIQALLIKANEIEWAKNIGKIKEEFESAKPQEVKILARKTINLFGGMGSFNDIVLYVNHKADPELNDLFNKLKNELFGRLEELAIN